MDDDTPIEFYRMETLDRCEIINWYRVSNQPAKIDIRVDEKCREASDALLAAVKAWIPRRTETIAALKVLADHVSKVKKDESICNIVGRFVVQLELLVELE